MAPSTGPISGWATRSFGSSSYLPNNASKSHISNGRGGVGRRVGVLQIVREDEAGGEHGVRVAEREHDYAASSCVITARWWYPRRRDAREATRRIVRRSHELRENST